MKQDFLQTLAQIVLPNLILDHFDIIGVKQDDAEIHIQLDEKMNVVLNEDANFKSKGFMEAMSITDSRFATIRLS